VKRKTRPSEVIGLVRSNPSPISKESVEMKIDPKNGEKVAGFVRFVLVSLMFQAKK
jgi:hypothetical protein